jgi:poly-gamma-glutamate capsule biosynthesis protein CapA/YwtB (metallophosphatase superfamily)
MFSQAKSTSIWPDHHPHALPDETPRLVIGHHAHVPQPVVELARGADGEGTWVAYGLGNYLSNQDDDCCSAATSSGLLFTAHVTRPGASAADGRRPGRHA